MQTILIPTDFSENSLNAIKYAVEIYKNKPAKIYILHAYADGVYVAMNDKTEEDFPNVCEQTRMESEKSLLEFKNQMEAFSKNPEHDFETISDFGQLVDSVNELVNRKNIDLVVMGTKGETEDKDLTFGSNTLQVIKYVNCPVLAVPSEYKDVEPQNILFPTDYMLPYKPRELELISGIAKSFDTQIHLLHVSKFPNLSLRKKNNKQFLKDSFSDNEVTTHVNSSKDITTGINAFINENKVDRLVMVNTRHSYLENLLYESTIEKIGLHVNIPFLVLQNLSRS